MIYWKFMKNLHIMVLICRWSKKITYEKNLFFVFTAFFIFRMHKKNGVSFVRSVFGHGMFCECV